jgi:hypothetical protein
VYVVRDRETWHDQMSSADIVRPLYDSGYESIDQTLVLEGSMVYRHMERVWLAIALRMKHNP